MQIKHILCAGLLLCGMALHAQRTLSLEQMPGFWQANAVNPAFFPEGKHVVIGLPAFSLDGVHSGNVSYHDLLREEAGHTVLDFSQLIDRLEPENELGYDHRIETLSFAMRLPGGAWTVQVGHAMRMNAGVQYPKTLPELLWNGNGPFVGQTLDIAPQVEAFDFSELGVGLAFEKGKIRVGARYKLLSGINAIRTDADHNKAQIYTSNDIYQLSLDTDFGFYSASAIADIDSAGLGFDVITAIEKGRIFSANKGSAIDLGFQFQATEKLRVSASVLDLGARINWKSKSNYFISNGAYTYEGANFPGTNIINGADSIDFSTKLDTLNDIFHFEKNAANFSTSLPLRIYVGAQYQIRPKCLLSASVYHQQREQAKSTALGLGVQWMPLKWLSLGGLYAFDTEAGSNIGLQLGLKPGPVQVFFASDSLLSAFAPKRRPSVNFSAGLALAF